MKTFVLYHQNCMDGTASAWSAWMFYKTKGISPKFIEVGYQAKIHLSDEEIKDSDIIIADFSYSESELRRVEKLAKSIIVLDHHKTSQAHLEKLSFASFDLDKSGAMLTWLHFHPGVKIPRLIQYVQDRDLWLFKLPFSKEVNAVVRSFNRVGLDMFSEFEKLSNRLEDDTEFLGIVNEGSAILKADQQNVEIVIKRSLSFVSIAGYSNIPAVNSSVYESEIGSRLLSLYPDAPFSAIYYDVEGGTSVYWSLRSRSGSNIDVGKIAGTLGGGGHPAASAFRVVKS